MSSATATRSPYDAMTVTVPPGTSGKVEVRQYEVTPAAADFERMRAIFNAGRCVPAGTYTGLYRNGGLWMSDTPDEKRDNWPVIHAARSWQAERVLINGLGLGCVVAAMLAIDSVRHVDVVEIDPDVVALVGPHYERMAADMGKTVKVHLGDAYTITWPRDARWDIAWSDIWQYLCTDNLEQMTRLSRKYGRRVNWHGHWGKELLQRRRAAERRRGW